MTLTSPIPTATSIPEFITSWYERLQPRPLAEVIADPASAAIFSTDMIVGFCERGNLASARVGALKEPVVGSVSAGARAGCAPFRPDPGYPPPGDPGVRGLAGALRARHRRGRDHSRAAGAPLREPLDRDREKLVAPGTGNRVRRLARRASRICAPPSWSATARICASINWPCTCEFVTTPATCPGCR